MAEAILPGNGTGSNNVSGTWEYIYAGVNGGVNISVPSPSASTLIKYTTLMVNVEFEKTITPTEDTHLYIFNHNNSRFSANVAIGIGKLPSVILYRSNRYVNTCPSDVYDWIILYANSATTVSTNFVRIESNTQVQLEGRSSQAVVNGAVGTMRVAFYGIPDPLFT